MTADGRIQQVSRTVLEAVRKHKLLTFEPADSGCEIAKLWLEAATIKASNYLRQQEISDLLADCRRFKAQQLGILTQDATLDNFWLTAAQAGKRFVTQRVTEMPSVCKLYESDSDSGVDMHVLGQILLKADNGSENVMGIVSTTNPDPVFIKTGLRFPMWAGDGQVYFVPDESVTWRRKFLHRNLARSVGLYDVWHLEQVGESPSRRLGSMLRIGSPVLLAGIEEPARHVGVSELQEGIARVEAKAWIASCRSPQAAIQTVVKLLLIRAYRAFKHWLCISLWQSRWDNRRQDCLLMCGEAVWTAVLRKEGENRVWLANGELHTVCGESRLSGSVSFS